MFYIIARTARLIIRAFEIFMFLRAVLSWIMPPDSNKVTVFLYNITEPVISPVRNFLSRFEFIRNFPIDISFLVVLIILELVQRLLYF